MESDFGRVRYTACDVCSPGLRWVSHDSMEVLREKHRDDDDFKALSYNEIMEKYKDELTINEHQSGPMTLMMSFKELQEKFGWIEKDGRHVCHKCQQQTEEDHAKG